MANAGSAEMKRLDSLRASASVKRRSARRPAPVRNLGGSSTDAIHTLFPLHRRRFRTQRRGFAESPVRLLPGKRISKPVHGLQRVEPPNTGGSETSAAARP